VRGGISSALPELFGTPVRTAGERGDLMGDRQKGTDVRGPALLLTARLLGGCVIAVDGCVVDTSSSRRTRNLLAYLVTHRDAPVPRDVLMDVFWPRASPDAARNSLHVALTGVRRALRVAATYPLLQRRFDTYQLVPPGGVWVDVTEFEHYAALGQRLDRAGDLGSARRAYETASDLYEGDFLADDPYSPWPVHVREHLRLQVIELRTRLVDFYLDGEDLSLAMSTARAALVLDPCNELLHRRLIVCYGTRGQVHRALTQYHQCAELLWNEFRVRPSAETTRIFEELRSPALVGVTERAAGRFPNHARHAPPRRLLASERVAL
jgi:SARP family transcriptional regulator, regulator of embCAB operon